MVIQLKRAYEPPAPDDGCRILVDRLWPRGVSKDAARIDLWLKELAPCTELRRWFGHDSSKWVEFRMRYFHELDEHPDAVAQLRESICKEPVTLVYAAKDQEHNNVNALKAYLESNEEGNDE